jgi:hypothetical protein
MDCLSNFKMRYRGIVPPKIFNEKCLVIEENVYLLHTKFGRTTRIYLLDDTIFVGRHKNCFEKMGSPLNS